MKHPSRLRIELAQRIAAEIVENQSPWQNAREAVLSDMRSQLLRLPGNSIPCDDEIESAVREYCAIFCSDKHQQTLLCKRQLALSVLQHLKTFDAYLCGAVLNGSATEQSNICLEIFCDDVKSVEIALMQLHINFEPIHPSNGNMPEPLESLGFLLPTSQRYVKEGVRIDIYSQDKRSLNPYKKKPDPWQQDWEAMGRIDGSLLYTKLVEIKNFNIL